MGKILGNFEKAWTRYVGLILLSVTTYSIINLFYNDDYKLLIYPTKFNLKGWDMSFTLTIGKKINIKKYEDSENITKPRPNIDLQCIKKF